MRYRQGKTKPLPGAGIDRGHPLSRGLIGCWNFNEGAGSRVHDATGKYGSGVFTAVSGSPTWEVGQHGRQVGLAFASTQYIEVPHNPAYPISTGSNGGSDDIRNRFTYQVKFYLNSLRNFNGIMTKVVANAARPFDNHVGSSGTLNILAGNSVNIAVRTLAAGVWYDMVVVQAHHATSNPFPGIRVYFDDGFDAALIGPTDYSADAGSIMFGNRDDDVTPLDGKILYGRLWNRALTRAEVSLLYAEPYCFMANPSSSFARLFVAPPPPSARALYYARSQGLI